MMDRLDGHEGAFAEKTDDRECTGEVEDEAVAQRDSTSRVFNSQPPLPWIGSLPNPHVGPIVVLNENGHLVPVFTASDLLRSCRYFWQR